MNPALSLTVPPPVSMRRPLTCLLERGLRRHPVLTCAAALAVTGAGMVAAVALFALSAVLPLCLLFDLLP